MVDGMNSKMSALLMQRTKQVKVVALTDVGLSIFELIQSGIRFLGISGQPLSRVFYHFMGQSFIFPTIYLIFSIVQGIFGIRLYGATLDISTELWIASKKSIWWQRLSYLFILFHLLELFVILYIFITQIYSIATILPLFVSIWEIAFRICGIFIVQKFIQQISIVHHQGQAELQLQSHSQEINQNIPNNEN